MVSGDQITPRVGIVVPTLGKRSEYLFESLNSIKDAGNAHVLIVAPVSFSVDELLASGLANQSVVDPGTGLADAINLGINSLPPDIEYANWLGDDDLLAKDSITNALAILESDSTVVLVFGGCDYIDTAGKKIWHNKSGKWAAKILRFGPDLIPQPGALFRRTVFDLVGGLSKEYDWAFDYDLFIKLRKLGRFHYLSSTLASFRWHPESLSVEFRKRSVGEASQVRRAHLPAWLRPISIFWEYPIRTATLLAGYRVTNKARKLK